MPPTKTEGEVDQRRLRGGGRLSQLSSALCSAVDLLRLTGSRWSSEAERTESPHKAGHGRWRQDFSPLQEEGRGKELARGNQSNPFQNWSGRHTGGQAAQSAQKARPRAPRAPKPAAANPGSEFIHCIKLSTDAAFILSFTMLQKHHYDLHV